MIKLLFGPRASLPVFLIGTLLISAVPLSAQVTLDTIRSASMMRRDGRAVDSLRARYRLPLPPAGIDPSSYRSAPAMGANSPIAFGAAWGDVHAGAAYTPRARNVDEPDGVMAVGFGLGDAVHLVGLEVVGTSFSTVRSGIAKNAGVDVKLHRILPGGVGIAVGWENALVNGQVDDRSVYGVVSKWMQFRPADEVFSTVSLSAGVGNGRFRRWEDWRDDRETVGVFASAAVRVAEPVSLILDWTGQDLVFGASVAPFRRWNLVVTPGLADLTGMAGDGVRFVIGASYVLRLRPGP